MSRPRYVKQHVLKTTLVLDSASFLFRNEGLDPRYAISDRRNLGEKPVARLSLIKERSRPLQLRIACTDALENPYHVERPDYYAIDPKNWREWAWIIFPSGELSRLIKFLSEALAYVRGDTSEPRR